MRELIDEFRERFLKVARELMTDEDWKIHKFQIVPIMMMTPVPQGSRPGTQPEPIVSMSYFLMRLSRDPGDWLAQHDIIVDPFTDESTIRKSISGVMEKLRQEYWNTFPPEPTGDGPVTLASARTEKQ